MTTTAKQTQDVLMLWKNCWFLCFPGEDGSKPPDLRTWGLAYRTLCFRVSQSQNFFFTLSHQVIFQVKAESHKKNFLHSLLRWTAQCSPTLYHFITFKQQIKAASLNVAELSLLVSMVKPSVNSLKHSAEFSCLLLHSGLTWTVKHSGPALITSVHIYIHVGGDACSDISEIQQQQSEGKVWSSGSTWSKWLCEAADAQSSVTQWLLTHSSSSTITRQIWHRFISSTDWNVLVETSMLSFVE